MAGGNRLMTLLELHQASSALERAHASAIDAGFTDLAASIRSAQQQVTAAVGETVSLAIAAGNGDRSKAAS